MPESSPPDAAVLTRSVNRDLRRQVSELAPWFAANMPAYYVRTHDAAQQARQRGEPSPRASIRASRRSNKASSSISRRCSQSLRR